MSSCIYLSSSVSPPGPVPGLGLLPNYQLTVGAITIAGFGLGAQLVAAFAEGRVHLILI